MLTAAFGDGLQVPPGHVWLQGDNTLNSTDSRHYGPVPYALIKGRAILKVRHTCLNFKPDNTRPSVRTAELPYLFAFCVVR